MIRAGVFIGVDKTGNLQRLHDAASGARRMYEWSLAQGMADQTHAKLITDADNKKVDPDRIYDAIKAIIDGPGVDQLIVYFAGHGVNINRTEHWLLTDAPVRTSAAINVSGSVELARYAGIQHVVFISDACRVAPEGIQAQNVRGVDVFPNDGTGDRAKPVDQFFACLLGRTAAEIKDPTIAAQNYTALYTNALLDALMGTRPEVLEPGDTAGDNSLYVQPGKLQNYLESEVPRRVKAMGLAQKVNQNPDALLALGGRWIARIEAAVAPATRSPLLVSSEAFPRLENLRIVTERLVQSAVEGNREVLDQNLHQANTGLVAGAKQLAGTTEQLVIPFGPDHFETQCGIKVRGARVINFFALRATVEFLGNSGDLLRIDNIEGPAASVLLFFEGNVGAVVPVLPGFLAALTFDEGELVDIAYEPSVNSWRWDLYKDRANEVRAIRAVAAASSQHGRFRLDGEEAIKVAQKMQYAKGIDPTLAVYAAYAYHDLQAIERIQQMSRYLHSDVGVTFFDLALLSRALLDKTIGLKDDIVPFVPLLSQGWALLKAHRVKLHPALVGIESSMQESLWSLFDLAGMEKLKTAMQTQEVR
ncbi:MAG: hypothetical protein AB7P69_29185 [Candidatus Binatia bacterium]